jgi:hypothetical protein
VGLYREAVKLHERGIGMTSDQVPSPFPRARRGTLSIIPGGRPARPGIHRMEVVPQQARLDAALARTMSQQEQRGGDSIRGAGVESC